MDEPNAKRKCDTINDMNKAANVIRPVRLLRRELLVVFVMLGLALPLFAADDVTALPKKENFHLYLLAGQSNMAGRGKVEEQDTQPHPRVMMLTKDGSWKPAVDPIHFDKSVAGGGLGRSFAITLVEQDKTITIGLIPAACGGSPISTWQPGGYHDQTKSHPYDDAIARAKLAMKNGTLKGILWHQGESDSNAKLAPLYKDALKELIARFRKEFDSAELPFVIGQLGQFPERPWNDERKRVDAAHREQAKELKAVGFVSSDELKCNKDNIHFDAASLRTFGRRYAAAYQDLCKARK